MKKVGRDFTPGIVFRSVVELVACELAQGFLERACGFCTFKGCWFIFRLERGVCSADERVLYFRRGFGFGFLGLFGLLWGRNEVSACVGDGVDGVPGWVLPWACMVDVIDCC